MHRNKSSLAFGNYYFPIMGSVAQRDRVSERGRRRRGGGAERRERYRRLEEDRQEGEEGEV